MCDDKTREIAFHKSIKGVLTKRQQGYVMGAFRNVLGLQEQQEPAAADLLLPALRQYQHNDGSGFLSGYDRETTQRIVAGLMARIPDLGPEERAAFDEWVAREGGPEAAKHWPNDNGPGYANDRVQDYRTGWAECIQWMRRRFGVEE